jgi:ribulose-bisphosphate carboxylase large chain
MTNRIYAHYRIETAHPLEKAAAIMAGEQSAGTFVKVPGETPELQARHGARVEQIRVIETVELPSLPGSKPPKAPTPPQYQRAEVTLSFPFENIGASLTTLLSTVCGNLYELSQFSGLRLMDVELPNEFADRYPGPAFGVAGTRQLAGVYNRPLLGTIIKPSVGFSPEQTAAVVQTLCEAGIDFIKDDELQANSPHSPLEDRVQAVMRVIRNHAQKTGKKVMYAFNITGEIDEMLYGHDVVVEHEGTCVMVNLLSVGMAAISHFRRHASLPIHGHRAGWGALSRHPYLGMEYVALQKFYRLAGVDHLHVNGLRNKFSEPDESVIASARACTTPLFGGYAAMPVFSSGQWAGQAPDTYRALGNVDLMYLAGGGIMAHPSGPAAGITSIQQAWQAAIQGISLESYAASHVELRQAIELYGAL